MTGKLVIFSAPSGSGKSTIINYLMQDKSLHLHFSISATNRPPRGQERDGVEYFFLSTSEFIEKINHGDFVEYEEVYPGRFYGTLKTQVEKQLESGENIVFDIDGKGGCNIKKMYGERALSLFIQPPSLDELRTRLEKRSTDSADMIEKRLAKAKYELSFASEFDHIVVNDCLEDAEDEALTLIRDFLKK